MEGQTSHAATASPPTQGVGLDIDQLYAFVNAQRAGDFSARLPVTGDWRSQEVAIFLNRFMEDMDRLTSEIRRVTTEMADGVFGGTVDALVPPGPWKDCVDAVNALAWAITSQIRDVARTTKLMAAGDPSRPVTVPCKGEMKDLKDAVNTVRERLATGT